MRAAGRGGNFTHATSLCSMRFIRSPHSLHADSNKAMALSEKDALYKLRKLHQRIKTLSTGKFLLHPTKCRCLALSYSLLLPSLFPSSSSSVNVFQNAPLLLEVLLHTLQEGEHFLKDCTDYANQASLLWPFSRTAQAQKWLMDKALRIALSSEILDVHLHDLLLCISALIWALDTYYGDRQGVMNQAQSIEDRLKSIWAAADEEADVKSMQELLSKFKAKEHEEFCELLCRRLSESTSRARLNLTDAVVPPHLLMDPLGFELQKDIRMLAGGSAVVTKTKWMGRKFACKHIARSTSEQEFGSEAAIHASLRHANVVQLVWCTRRAASRALVMELMDEDLGQVIAQRMSAGMNPPFSLPAAVDIMLQIAKGMEYLHDKHIMHRDLKSSNVLVRHLHRTSYADHKTDQMCVKVADFGISRVKYDTSLFTTKKVGTGIWRAPEVMDIEDESKYTNQADVYSFAIVCSEICTGLPPEKLLPCEKLSELSKLLKKGGRPKLPSSCPPAIANYIEKCWHGDASARPTFNQICKVFRFFKACLVLGEMDLLQTPLPDDMFDLEERQKIAAERQSQGMFNHPILDVSSEIYPIFRLVPARNPISTDISKTKSNTDILEVFAFSTGDSSSLEKANGASLHAFSYGDMRAATRDFHTDRILGEGVFGEVFRGHLDEKTLSLVKPSSGMTVAIKYFYTVQGYEGYKTWMVEVNILGGLRHPNIVKLIGFCAEDKKRLLVYEYMSRGSLDNHLIYQGNHNEGLSWDTRMKVVLGVARGLAFLHDAQQHIIHGNLTPASILLDAQYNAKVSGFAFAKDIATGEDNHVTLVMKDPCYSAPEYMRTGYLTVSCDVYSFGAVLFELLTGQLPHDFTQANRERKAVELAKASLDNNKPELHYIMNPSLNGHYPHEVAHRVTRVALKCLNKDAMARPTMKEVVESLEEVIITSSM